VEEKKTKGDGPPGFGICTVRIEFLCVVFRNLNILIDSNLESSQLKSSEK
jgi:hypothetical protein